MSAILCGHERPVDRTAASVIRPAKWFERHPDDLKVLGQIEYDRHDSTWDRFDVMRKKSFEAGMFDKNPPDDIQDLRRIHYGNKHYIVIGYYGVPPNQRKSCHLWYVWRCNNGGALMLVTHESILSIIADKLHSHSTITTKFDHWFRRLPEFIQDLKIWEISK